jgi:hypothetical protein
VVGVEPPQGTPALSRDLLWSSIGNPESFELTRASLCNALNDVGYSSVVEAFVPPRVTDEPRGTFVALKRPSQSILIAPALNERIGDRLPETPAPLSVALLHHPAYRSVRDVVPRSVKSLLKRAGRRLTGSA